MTEDDVTRGLPADLVAVLRDQSVIIPQDAGVFAMLGAWAKAPVPTASAEIKVTWETIENARSNVGNVLYNDARRTISNTTPTGSF